MTPQPKIEQLRACMAAGNWRKALSIAAKFPRLGAERGVILDAHMALTNPRFLVQIKRDPEAALAAGIAALRSKYSI